MVKKIIIKEKKEGNKNKTYVTGITAIDGITSKKTAEEFAKKLKTRFGCGCKVDSVTSKKDGEDKSDEEKTEERKQKDELVLIFQGNHKDKISRYIKENFPKVIVQ